MKFRPITQLRWRNVEQLDIIHELATEARLSVNEWMLRFFEQNEPALDDAIFSNEQGAAPGATAPGQVDFGAQGKPEKNRRAATPPLVKKLRAPAIRDVVVKARQGGSTISTMKAGTKVLGSPIADRSLDLGIPAEIMDLQPTVADTYGGIARGAGPGLPPDPDTTSWTEAQWDDYYETHRIDPATGSQYPNSEFCSLRPTDSCNRYNTGGHCLRCR